MAQRGTKFLEKLPFRVKLLILAGSVVVVAALFYLLVYQPILTQQMTLGDDIQRLDDAYKIFKEKAKGGAQLEQKLDKARAEYERLSQMLPDKSEIVDLMRNITEVGRLAGLDFVLFNPREPTFLKEQVAEIPIEIQVRGTYRELADFFSKVDNLSRIVNFEEIEISSSKLTENAVVLEAHLLAKAYRLLTPEEEDRLREQAKEQAKQKKK
ncbi:MAG: type 4a pilus biogenesis protein PilO [Deltaproteobacteria bacterium]|nr:type 4a pilus biogenesis protein PilO [Deltaproteobacteria bacterium]